MTALQDNVQVNISVESAQVTRPGFGTALGLFGHSYWPELVREFSSTQEIIDAGAPATSAVVKFAQAYFGQELKPLRVKIGKRVNLTTPTIKLTPSNLVEGYEYAFDASAENETLVAISHINGAGETVANIAADLQSQLDAVANLSATDNGTDVDVDSGAAGPPINLVGVDHDALSIEDISADGGIATDLAAVNAEDPDWYGLIIDSNNSAEVLAAAPWAQANDKLFGATVSDTEIASAVDTDVASVLQDNLYTQTFPFFDADATLSYAAAAWMGDRFPTDPGSSTWKYKDLAGVTTDDLSAGERTNLRNKNCNFYINIAGVGVTHEGVVSSGEYIDIIRGIAWLKAEIEINVFALLARVEKVPFTNAGVDSIRNQILAALNTGIGNGLLSSDPAPVVTAPRVEDVSAVDKANRCLPDVEFSATLAGAIHIVKITGKVSV